MSPCKAASALGYVPPGKLVTVVGCVSPCKAMSVLGYVPRCQAISVFPPLQERSSIRHSILTMHCLAVGSCIFQRTDTELWLYNVEKK
jgi:hypothetical protein